MNTAMIDMLCLANKNMKYKDNASFSYSRGQECDWLATWYHKLIGKSWLSDCRGLLKKGNYIKYYQTPYRAEHGRLAGTIIRGQIRYKGAMVLVSMGISVAKKAWASIKKHWKPFKKVTTPEPTSSPPIKTDEPTGPGNPGIV